MNFPFYIAKRYLFAKKSHNVINVISGISVAGIALASFALICTLSVFNGFNDLVATLFTKFDPELKIVSTQGKLFNTDNSKIKDLSELPFVEEYSFSLEEQALIQYRNSQQIITIKGVEESFYATSGIEDILRGNGIFMLADEVCNYGIPGIGIISKLGSGIQPAEPFKLYVPKQGERVNMINAAANFNSCNVYSPGVAFQVNQAKYDENYLLVSLDVAEKLTGYNNQATAIELKLSDNISVKKAKKRIAALLGTDFKVLDRYEQQEDIFKVVKLEKFISYLFLTFILLISCFNIISSLIMLMIEKQSDTEILRSLGADKSTTTQIFIYDGILISMIGAVSGVVLGTIAALLQQQFGFIPLGTNGGFIVDAYPVNLKIEDIVLVLATVLVVSYISIKPIGKLAKRVIGQ
ncbi:MAG: ABC transporter permease [Bacteroidaceae bacterium]|nr:ABC transporter permease [Bacteroidaceae bacterium]